MVVLFLLHMEQISYKLIDGSRSFYQCYKSLKIRKDNGADYIRIHVLCKAFIYLKVAHDTNQCY